MRRVHQLHIHKWRKMREIFAQSLAFGERMRNTSMGNSCIHIYATQTRFVRRALQLRCVCISNAIKTAAMNRTDTVIVAVQRQRERQKDTLQWIVSYVLYILIFIFICRNKHITKRIVLWIVNRYYWSTCTICRFFQYCRFFGLRVSVLFIITSFISIWMKGVNTFTWHLCVCGKMYVMYASDNTLLLCKFPLPWQLSGACLKCV